jgi:hypothetical protein
MLVQFGLTADRSASGKARVALRPLGSVVGSEQLEIVQVLVSEIVSRAVLDGRLTAARVEVSIEARAGRHVDGEVSVDYLALSGHDPALRLVDQLTGGRWSQRSTVSFELPGG